MGRLYPTIRKSAVHPILFQTDALGIVLILAGGEGIRISRIAYSATARRTAPRAHAPLFQSFGYRRYATCRRSAPVFVDGPTMTAAGINPPPSLHALREYTRRCRTASASTSSTGSVCVQLKHASVIDTPYCNGTPGFKS